MVASEVNRLAVAVAVVMMIGTAGVVAVEISILPEAARLNKATILRNMMLVNGRIDQPPVPVELHPRPHVVASVVTGPLRYLFQ